MCLFANRYNACVHHLSRGHFHRPHHPRILHLILVGLLDQHMRTMLRRSACFPYHHHPRTLMASLPLQAICHFRATPLNRGIWSKIWSKRSMVTTIVPPLKKPHRPIVSQTLTSLQTTRDLPFPLRSRHPTPTPTPTLLLLPQSSSHLIAQTRCLFPQSQ